MTRTSDKGRWSTRTAKFGIPAIWAIAGIIGIVAISNWPMFADPLAPAEPAPSVGSHPSLTDAPAESYPSP